MKRSLKKVLLRICNPLDELVRRMNGKADLPPLHLRWDAGPLRGFEASGSEFRVYLKLFGGLTPSSRVLDIGCGCGQLALELRDHLDERGMYVGCDVNGEAIAWCIRHLGVDERFSFFHMDVSNGLYNPAGRIRAADFSFPVFPERFDLVVLKSVFTHMREEDMAHYLSLLPSLLSRSGKCVASFFLLNEHQERLARMGLNLIAFTPGRGNEYAANPSLPEAITAYKEERVMELVRRSGLRPAREVIHGTWTGDRSGLSHQDILVLEAGD